MRSQDAHRRPEPHRPTVDLSKIVSQPGKTYKLHGQIPQIAPHPLRKGMLSTIIPIMSPFRSGLPARLPRFGRRWFSLLRPGYFLKRWLLVMLLGVTMIGLGLALLLTESYLAGQFPPAARVLALSFLPVWLRIIMLLSVGGFLVVWGVWKLNANVVTAFFPPSAAPNNMQLMEQIIQRRSRRMGPKVVTIGGGTGMPTLLRGLREHTDNITAIVTVADDGGSSGRLRRGMGMLPPGDFRNNIAALSDSEELMTHLLQYRFGSNSNIPSHMGNHPEAAVNANGGGTDDLGGHNFGNLFITAMAAITGSFEQGIAESSRVLAVRGRVLPSTLEHVTLCAEVVSIRPDGKEEWHYVRGESQIPESGGKVVRVRLEPEEVRAYPEAIRAILAADIIIAGPGSFYTSTLPNLLVPSVRQAVAASQATRIFVCNVANQPGETDGYSVSDYMRQLRRHAGDAIDTVLANSNYHRHLQPSSEASWVNLPDQDEHLDYNLFTADLINETQPTHHDSRKLAARILEIHHTLQSQPKRRNADQSANNPVGRVTLDPVPNQ